MLQFDQIKEWRERGWTTGYLDVDVPSASARDLLPPSDLDTEFGSPKGVGEFPTGASSLDDIVANDILVKNVQHLLGTTNIRLLQSDVWAKNKGIDQRMHQDWGNNTFLPPSWDSPDAVAIIIYYDDNVGGETRVVSRQGEDDPAYKHGVARIAPGYHLPFINDRTEAEAMVRRREPRLAAFRDMLYDREEIVPYERGTVLYYRHDLWHRGTPTNGTRRVHSLGYVRGDAPAWTTWNAGFARKSYYGVVEDLILRWTPKQRTLLGIPTHLTSLLEKRYKYPLARL